GLAPSQLFGYGRSDWSAKLIRGLRSEAPAGFRSRRGDGHDRTPVAPQNAAFPTYKAPRVHYAARRRGRMAACGARAAAGDAGDRILNSQSRQEWSYPTATFLQGLSEAGYVEGATWRSSIASPRDDSISCRRDPVRISRETVFVRITSVSLAAM